MDASSISSGRTGERIAIAPDPLARQHNERKKIFKLRGKHIRPITGPIHSSVKARWDANAHDYRNKSKAMKKLLKYKDNDWSKIRVAD